MTVIGKVRASKSHDQQCAWGGKVTLGVSLVFPVLPPARHLGLSALVTFCDWALVLALLMSV